MLLLDATMSIAPAKEAELNTWYHLHVPRLVAVPGYESGNRYVAMTPGPRYVALYEIRDHAALPLLLGQDTGARDEVTLSEWAVWDRDLLPHTSDLHLHVYEPLAATPPRLLRGGRPLVVVRVETDADDPASADAAWRDAVLPRLATEPDVTGAVLLRQSPDPVVGWLNTGPHRLLGLIECAGVAAARTLAERDAAGGGFAQSLADAAGAAAARVTAYRPIARHWNWERRGDGAQAEVAR
ncbi:MAG TPA: hypothetical protein VFF79_10395 [Conexibacter sp.]|jgi:hypothetical protein|nr:hypothetical protein [Conexibacter sp.]